MTHVAPDINLSDIQLLLLDVDGVLTRGTITYTDAGEQIKQFSVKDGLGIRLLMDAGVDVGIVTGRTSNALLHRCRDLGIQLIFDGVKDKAVVVRQIAEKTGIEAAHMAFVGDDLIDLPAMTRVGTSFCVADASEDIKPHAHFVTEKRGGHGAVREVCEKILRAKGIWGTILEKYLS